MVEVTRTFTVRRAPGAVLDYLADYCHTTEWGPGTVSCERVDDGPVRIGATWRTVSTVLGREIELTHELTVRDPDRLVFVGRGDTATTTDDISVHGGTDGTSTITYHAALELHGLAKLATPLSKVAFEKHGSDAESGLLRLFGPLDA